MGVESSDRMMKSLDEFAKLDEFTDFHNHFRKIVTEARGKFEEN